MQVVREPLGRGWTLVAFLQPTDQLSESLGGSGRTLFEKQPTNCPPRQLDSHK